MSERRFPAIVILALAMLTSGVYGQGGFQCPPGSVAVGGGGGTMCQCADGSFASISGCAGEQSSPAPNYGYEPAPTPPILDNPVVKAFEWLGQKLSKETLAVEPGARALSQQLPRGSVSLPPNREAEDALRALIAQSPPSGARPDPVRQSNGVSLHVDPFTLRPVASMPAGTPVQAATTPGTYAGCAGSSTFGGRNPPWCEAGDYIYFRNGEVLRK